MKGVWTPLPGGAGTPNKGPGSALGAGGRLFYGRHMIYTSSVTSVSWIPSEAVEGISKPLFEVGVTHYDQPPPDRLDGIEHLRASDRFRFANRLSAWIEVVDGRIVDGGYNDESGGVMGATTVRLGLGDATFAAVGLEDLQRPAELDGATARFVQTTGGRTAIPAPRHIKRPPFFRLQAPLVWTTLALTLRADGSAHFEVSGASPFPRHWVYDADDVLAAKVGVADFRGWYHGQAGASHPVGRRGYAGTGHGGRDRTRTGAVEPHHAVRCQTCDTSAEAGPHPHRTGRRRGGAVSAARRRAGGGGRRARWWPRSGRARLWANGPRWRVVYAPRRCGP